MATKQLVSFAQVKAAAIEDMAKGHKKEREALTKAKNLNQVFLYDHLYSTKTYRLMEKFEQQEDSK